MGKGRFCEFVIGTEKGISKKKRDKLNIFPSKHFWLKNASPQVLGRSGLFINVYCWSDVLSTGKH